MNDRRAPTVWPVINGFEVVPNALRCSKCGADLHLSSWLHDQHDGCARVACLACGTIVAHIAADLIHFDDDPAPRHEKADGEWPFDDDRRFDTSDDDFPPF